MNREYNQAAQTYGHLSFIFEQRAQKYCCTRTAVTENTLDLAYYVRYGAHNVLKQATPSHIQQQWLSQHYDTRQYNGNWRNPLRPKTHCCIGVRSTCTGDRFVSK